MVDPPPSLTGELRDHAERGEPKQLFHILRGLDRIVEVFEEEGEAHSEEKANHSSQKEASLSARHKGSAGVSARSTI